MRSRDAKTMLGVLWFAAASVGVLIGAIFLVVDEPASRLLIVLLILATTPFGLMRPAVPWLWAAVVAWPTIVLGILNTGWVSILLLIPAMVGVYSGDWLATWWNEAHPKAAPRTSVSTSTRSGYAPDGTPAFGDDGLPPAMPDRR